MLNILWPVFIIISFIYGIFTGRVEEINANIFSSAEEAVSLSITFLGTLCLWNGIMNIALKSKIIDNLVKIFNPIMKILFPSINKNDKEYKEISMNVVANVLGLGNAATPIGLKAMKTMNEKNEKKGILNDNMAMFIILNTASIQIIPTTVLAIRNSLNSVNPSSVIIPIWIATILAALVAIIAAKLLSKKF